VFDPSEDTSNLLLLGHMLNDAAGHVRKPNKDSTESANKTLRCVKLFCMIGTSMLIIIVIVIIIIFTWGKT
jgi:hypothetical protein